MARRYNELFIGAEFLNEEGREIKHAGLIHEFGNPNISKISDSPINLIGIDIETNHLTAEMKLLGIWNGENYYYYKKDFLVELFEMVKTAFWKKGANALAYWNKLDPFVLYKQFLILFGDSKQAHSLARYGKISGEWNRKHGSWNIQPVIEVEILRGRRTFRFGIKNVIRSSVQFYFYELVGGMPKQLNNGNYPLSTVWAYDIATLYKNGLEREALGVKDEETGTYPNARLPYYSKLGEEFHLVDWDRFETDSIYRKLVLKSNELDARAVYDLGTLTINQFKTAFHYYPRNLISSGSIARSAIVATLTHKYRSTMLDQDEADRLVYEDVKSIGIMNYYDNWSTQIDHENLKDLFCLFYEAYSGGYIEAMMYGMIKKGAYSDIASAYIKYITELMDLRDSKVSHGTGEPPHVDNSYCVIRGTVDIPLEVNYMPITVKHVTSKDTNVRATGIYKGSYYLIERDYMLSLGAKFTDETWYNVETTGLLSPIAEVAQVFINIRDELLAANDSAEYLAKSAAASLYGIQYEATKTYIESDQLEILTQGYRGGEFLNPLYAGYTTASTRIQLSKASTNIVKNGGSPAILMTDCVFWEGDASQLDPEFIRDKKTLGFFETPVEFEQMACLGTGRYSYIDSEKGYVTTKNRGLNVTDLHNPDGVDIGEYNWINALKLAEHNKSFKIIVKVRLLISVGMVAHTKELKSLDKDGNVIKIPIGVKDLGRVLEVYRDVDLVTGLTKRILDEPLHDIKDITQGSVSTRSIYYSQGMLGDGKIVDQTLPNLRKEVMKLTVKTAKSRDLSNRSVASYKYGIKNKDVILKTERDKYQHLKALGYSRDEAKLWCKRSYERIHTELLGGN